MIQLTQETVVRTRQWFADNARECVVAATEGEFHVNDLPRYARDQEASAVAFLAGERDHTFTFWQRAVYLQTGECPALLPNRDQSSDPNRQ